MRYIDKADPPAAFLDWLTAGNDDWTPTWAAFGGEPKAATKQALLAEQGALCAYCCEGVDASRSHIEHVEPRSRKTGNPARALDYRNLVASCPGRDDADPRLRRTRKRDLHCGEHKGDVYDAARFVSPLDPSCETAFVFNVIGGIAETEAGGDRARDTIPVLNLDAPRLRRGRAAAIAGFETALVGVDPASRQAVLSGLSERRADGTFREFYPAIASALAYLGGAPE